MSFYAVIVACHVFAQELCITIVDNRGPYKTAARCEERMIEMVSDLAAVWKQQELTMAYKSMECVERNKDKKVAT